MSRFACVVLAALIAAGALWRRARRDAPVERLVAAAQELAARAPARPAHAGPPIDASFTELGAPSLALLIGPADAVAASADPGLCAAAREGRAAWSALEPACREALARDGAALDALLRATHASRGGVAAPARFGGDGGLHHAVQHAARLAGLRIRELLAERRGPEAASTCLDALALARDAAPAGGLIGAMKAVACIGLALEPCRAALLAAGAPVRREAAAALLRLRDGLQPLSQAARDEALVRTLRAYGPLLPADARARLPAEAQALTAAAPPEPPPRPAVWPFDDPALAAAIAALDQPPESRRAALGAAQPLLSPGEPVARELLRDLPNAAARADRGLANLELLVAAALLTAAHDEQGRWPTDAEQRALLAPLRWPHPELIASGARIDLARRGDFAPLADEPLALALGAGP